VTPVYADAAALMLDVETPNGEALAIDSPALIDMLRVGIDEKHQPTLLRYDRCRPLSIFAVQSARKLGEETGISVDKRRFRANVYLDLTSSDGFAEDEFVGRSLRIGRRDAAQRRFGTIAQLTSIRDLWPNRAGQRSSTTLQRCADSRSASLRAAELVSPAVPPNHRAGDAGVLAENSGPVDSNQRPASVDRLAQ
jgi:hypothetical protein